MDIVPQLFPNPQQYLRFSANLADTLGSGAGIYYYVATMAKVPDRVKKQMEKAGLSEVNKPKPTPDHPKKSHVVMAQYKEGGETKHKLIRFGEQGADTKPPRKGESAADKAKRASFKARHAKNIKKGQSSAAYWADKEKW